MTEETQAKTGRKLLPIDDTQVERLAAMQCTNVEIAAFFDCSEATIRGRFCEILAKGREQGKIKLRRLQWKSAEDGNVTMQIWLGKNILGQRDQPEATTEELAKAIEIIRAVKASE